MGRYINSLDPNSRDWELPAVGKVKELLKVPGSRIMHFTWIANISKETFPKDLVCVVDNGNFEAALYCYDYIEFRHALPHMGDDRPRTWMIVPGADKLAKP